MPCASMPRVLPSFAPTWVQPSCTLWSGTHLSPVCNWVCPNGQARRCLYDTSHLSTDETTRMKINLRGRRAYLYRRRWVPVGPGVPHAHPAEQYIGAIDADAESIPPELLKVLTEAEQAQIQEKVLRPAAQARAAAAKREQDPMWRIAEARRLLSEAAQCSQSALVPGSSLTSVRMAMDNIRLLDPTPVRTPTQEPRPSADKLADTLVAVKAAAEAVRMGAYGLAPVEGARSTRPYRLWSDIFQAVEGGERSLLRALQDKGFVKTRKGS